MNFGKKTLNEIELQGQEFVFLALKKWREDIRSTSQPLKCIRLDVLDCINRIEYSGLVRVGGCEIRFKCSFLHTDLREKTKFQWDADSSKEIFFELSLGRMVTGRVSCMVFHRSDVYDEWSVDELWGDSAKLVATAVTMNIRR